MPAKADALRLLKLRPRSERELRGRLARKGYTPAAIDPVLQELKQKGLVDDFRLFGLRATGEQGALEEARALGARQAGRIRGLPAPARARRLGGFLARRGFEEEVVERVVREMVPHEGG
ncbi:MAG: RecX family transcriptional regulator [Candidatus Omnitrophica bacterium]|nr:RecX family transcriptional regulator [Candidatus Omnitrophota bacterium]